MNLEQVKLTKTSIQEMKEGNIILMREGYGQSVFKVMNKPYISDELWFVDALDIKSGKLKRYTPSPNYPLTFYLLVE